MYEPNCFLKVILTSFVFKIYVIDFKILCNKICAFGYYVWGGVPISYNTGD